MINNARDIEARPTQLPPSKITQEKLIDHVSKINQFFNHTTDLRTRMERIDRAYQRTGDTSSEHLRAQNANAYGDKSRLQNMQIPVVQPQVDTMQAYLAGIFLSGNPIFGFVSDPANIDTALMYETLTDEHSKYGGWVRQFNLFFKDILKYNIGAVEVDWKQKTVYQLDYAESITNNAQKYKKVLWEGNCIKRMPLYNCVWDTRCAPAELHEKGDFFGYTEPMSAIQLKQFIQDLDNRIAANVNGTLAGAIDFANRGNTANGRYYVPSINQREAGQAQDNIDWFAIAGLTSTDSNTLPTINTVSTYYLRIVPENFDMKVPARGNAQIWKLIVVNGAHIIYFERMSNLHNWLPVIMAQPLEDGLNEQTMSYAENAETYQDVASTIWNASLAAQRRAVYDRIFYDSSRIRKEDINSANPVARVPVKCTAYNKDVAGAFSHTSFTNDQFGIIGQQIAMITNMANIAQGSNPAQQGQFVKGNKTRHEYADVMGHSNNRQQMLALFLESQFFFPVKHMLKLNIMQYVTEGKIFSYERRTSIDIDPLKMRTASVEFEVSDGMLPTDRIIGADTFQIMLQAFAASQELQVEFDLTAMMLYYFKSQGARNMEQFKRTPEQQQAKINQLQQIATAQTAPAEMQQMMSMQGQGVQQ